MLTETTHNTPAGHLQRRWFADEYFELIVWFAEDATIRGFQLCYDRGRAERALTWTPAEGYSHNRIDEGEGDPTKNQTPILVADGTFDAPAVLGRLIERSAQLDPNIRDFVAAKIRAYPGRTDAPRQPPEAGRT